jgi:hypothetical protein
MLGFHGGTLTAVCVRRDDNDERVEPLVALLKRQTKLERLNCFGRASPSTLVALPETGTISQPYTGHADTGALDALKVPKMDRTYGYLVEALASGAAPSLRELRIDDGVFTDEDLEALGAMLETLRQAGRPGLENFHILNEPGLDSCSTAARSRLLRVTLPSAIELDISQWNDVVNDSILAVGAPRLRKIRAWCTLYPVSVEALEAILDYMHDPRQPAPFSELEIVCSALKRGMAVQHLR